MRTINRSAVGGFAAGVFGTVAAVSMLGLRQQPAEMSACVRRVEAFLTQIDQAEDQRAEADAQMAFWQHEMTSQDAEVTRLQFDPGLSPCVPFFLDRAKGLSNRAANSYLDARLHQALCARKVQALKAVIAAP